MATKINEAVERYGQWVYRAAMGAGVVALLFVKANLVTLEVYEADHKEYTKHFDAVKERVSRIEGRGEEQARINDQLAKWQAATNDKVNSLSSELSTIIALQRETNRRLDEQAKRSDWIIDHLSKLRTKESN